MRTAVFVSALLLFSSIARADGTAYVDTGRIQAAINETAEARQIYQDLSSENERRRAEVVAAQKAKPADAQQLLQKYQETMKAKGSDADARLWARPNRLIAKVAEARKLSAVAQSGGFLYVSPKLDITDEVLRRFKAGEGMSTEDENAKLRAELAAKDAKVAALEADKAALVKPIAVTPPKVPPAVASKGERK